MSFVLNEDRLKPLLIQMQHWWALVWFQFEYNWFTEQVQTWLYLELTQFKGNKMNWKNIFYEMSLNMNYRVYNKSCKIKFAVLEGGYILMIIDSYDDWINEKKN